jgi:hypothetical protein
MGEYDFAHIVVEGSLTQVLTHTGYNQSDVRAFRARKRVSRSILSWQFEFPRIKWWFLQQTRMAEVWSFRLMQRLVKYYEKNKKNSYKNYPFFKLNTLGKTLSNLS